MDKATQSSSSAGIRPLRPSPDSSYTSQQHEFSSQEQHNGSSDKQIKNRSCLPGYPNHRSSSSNSTNLRRVQQSKSNSMSALNHRDVATFLTDEIFMMDHLAIAPSASMPIHTSGALIANDNRDLYRYHHDRRNGNHLLPSRGNTGSTSQRRSRNAASSISRSATAALATPRSSSSSTSRARNSTHHKHHHIASQQRSNSTASTGSRYNHPMGATTSASPSKRSSSRISFSSQLSSTTTAPSMHDIDDIGTVSSRRSENSSTNHVQYNQHQTPPSPMTATNSTGIRQTKPNGKNCDSNQSIGSTATRSSTGTNTMGNTEAISKRRTQKSTLSPSHTLRTNNTMHTAATSSAIASQKVILDVDTMKHHAQETRRIIDALHRSYGASNDRRRVALTNACNLFDHTNEQLHNIELTNGALPVVTKHLYLHMQLQLPHTNRGIDDEISYLILSATEMLSRSAPSSFMNAVYMNTQLQQKSSSETTSNNDSVTFFSACLLRILDRLEISVKSCDGDNDSNRPDAARNDASGGDPIISLNDECVHCIGRVLISMCRSSDFRSIFYHQPDLVKGLTRISSTKANEVAAANINPECRLCRLNVLANLAKNSDNESRDFLYRFDGFLDSLLRYGNFDPSSIVRQAAAWCVLELTNAPSICSAMSKNSKVLGTLVKMILVDDKVTPSSPSTTVASTRESALTALQNISFDRTNRSHIIHFKSGMVLEALKKTLTTDIDAKSRRRAAGAVVNLVCDDTAEFMVSYKGLTDTLALVATQDNNLDVQTRAALSLTKLAAHISELQNHPVELSPAYLTILDALVVTSLSKLHSTRVTAAIRSLARNHPDHRPLLARHDGIVDTLIDVIQSSLVVYENATDDDVDDYELTNEQKQKSKITDRTNAIHAIAHLANSDDATRKHLCSRPTLLAAIVEATQPPDCQDLAIVILERLATVPSNRHILTRCNGLIVAVAEAVERESRLQQKGRNTVTNGQSNISENRHDDDDKYSDDGKSTMRGCSCYLAKALLMSLLVAM